MNTVAQLSWSGWLVKRHDMTLGASHHATMHNTQCCCQWLATSVTRHLVPCSCQGCNNTSQSIHAHCVSQRGAQQSCIHPPPLRQFIMPPTYLQPAAEGVELHATRMQLHIPLKEAPHNDKRAEALTLCDCHATAAILEPGRPASALNKDPRSLSHPVGP